VYRCETALLLLPGGGAEYCDEHVFVCLSARISQKPHVLLHPNFIYMLSVIVIRPSSGGVVVRYALPVLWVMIWAYFLIIMGQWCHDATAAASLQCHVRFNAPAAWYWFPPVVDNSGC